MPGGKKVKARGTSYEYRIRGWFKDRGWQSERNNLSGASTQISELIAKHDVRASNNGIFLQIEAKKTANKEKHKLQRKWITGLDFTNDEFLVFAFGRSDHYVLISRSYYVSLAGEENTPDVRYTARGDSQFTFHKAWVQDEDPMGFLWETHGELYVVTNLDDFITLIEKRGPLKALDPLSYISSATSVADLVEWYKENKHRLTNKEKCLYYGKLHRLEYNITDEASPEFIATTQWWRDTSDDVICKCPHCQELITHGQMKESRDNS